MDAKKKRSFPFLFFIFFFLSAHASEIKTTFWNTPRHGANIFNKVVTREIIRAAKKYGIEFIRLAPDKFPSLERDFLIGNADAYKELSRRDLKELKRVLDICAEEKMPVVLSMLSLPGSRWKQNNHGQDDLRIWTSESFQKQATQFWQDLLDALAGHPAIIGYNILNEPHPERVYEKKAFFIHTVKQNDVQEKLHMLYKKCIQAIRQKDKKTFIILDSSSYGDPRTFKNLIPQNDERVIYSFHMYAPEAYTNGRLNKKNLSYPGIIGGKRWDKESLISYLSDVKNFQDQHNLPSNRILVGEFGGYRTMPGLKNYFQDLIAIFNSNNWHRAFYAFREDTWPQMDYELGSGPLPRGYWYKIEKGEPINLNRNGNNPLFKVLINWCRP